MFARMRPCISVAAIGMVCVVSTESLMSQFGDETKKFEDLQRHGIKCSTCSIISVNDNHNIQQELRKY